MKVEISPESHPRYVREIGDLPSAPEVGDFVGFEKEKSPDSSWNGYVQSRRWTIHADGSVSVRCWVHRYPPERK